MIYYLCGDRELVTTQVQAKAGGKPWKLYDVDVTKDGLLKHLSGMLAVMYPEGEEAAPIDEPIFAPRVPFKSVEGLCPACKRTEIGAQMMANSFAFTDVEEAIYGITDVRYLDKIIAAVVARRQEIVEAA